MPGAIRRDGPAAKCGYDAYGWGKRGPKRGAVLHSADGYWAGLYSVLDDPARGSWHFTIGYDRFEQHYAADIHTWHSGDTDDDGGVKGNLELVGIEVLGRKGELMTPYQLDKTVEINAWLGAQNGRDTFVRFDGWEPDSAGVWVLAEHNQVSNTVTECPAHRWDTTWPAIMARLNATPEEGTVTHKAIMQRGGGFVFLVTYQDGKPIRKTYIAKPADAEYLIKQIGPLEVRDIKTVPML